MKLLYFGPLWSGSTALHRAEAFAALPGIEVFEVDEFKGAIPAPLPLWARIRWKLRVPADRHRANERLLQAAKRHEVDAAIVDSSQILSRSTLRALREMGCRCLAYYSPDDAVARHSVSWQVARAFGEWDAYFTTKSFNVEELRARGVRNPVLVGNSYDPAHHRPLPPQEVGPDYEKFDAVFVGAWEAERCRSINKLVDAGLSVAVFGPVSQWRGGNLDGRAALFPPALGDDYAKAMHRGKLALCFLRKASRDRITTRSVEIPAMARPMLAEQSPEHDAAFRSGAEYESFSSDEELRSKAIALLRNDRRRLDLAKAGRARCLEADYSTTGRAREMAAAMERCLSRSQGDGADG